jgi:site-specific recombinase XerD
MNNGVSPRAIQLAMGHTSLETTMGYMHAESLSVQSPLESILDGNVHQNAEPLKT